MRTIETTLYTFDELTKEAKENAIERIRETQDEPLYFFDEIYNERFSDSGFEGTEVQYCLSNSQGDGLSFSAENYNKLKELILEVLGSGKEKTAKLIAEHIEITIEGNKGRYCYASRTDVNVSFNQYHPKITHIIEEVERKLQDIYLSLCKELGEIGYAEIDYYYSDEAIIEHIEVNDYEFTEDGKLY